MLRNDIETGGTGGDLLISEKGESATENTAARETGRGKSEKIVFDRGDGK
jgi:hypothetical protein